VKILGAIELGDTRPHYGSTPSQRHDLLHLLKQLAGLYWRRGAIRIQHHAFNHKDADGWKWFVANRRWLEVHQLPPYSRELNPTERLWQHTRRTELTIDTSQPKRNWWYPVEGLRRDAITPGLGPLISPPFCCCLLPLLRLRSYLRERVCRLAQGSV